MNKEFENATETVVDEKVEAETTEEMSGGIELTDTSDAEEKQTDEVPEEEEQEEKPKGRYVTDEEINELVDRRVSRKMRKFEREHAKDLADYQDNEAILKEVVGGKDISEINSNLRDYYKEQGINLPEKKTVGLSDREIEILAKADANEFIEDGYDSMLNEANRLANIGYKNLDLRNKVIFDTLAEKLTEEKDKKELKSLGVKEELLNDQKFKDFKKQFNNSVPIKTVYEMYTKIQPKQKFENPGSMKSSKDFSMIKDYYSPEEASKFKAKDYRENPKLLEAVERSMEKWGK